MYKVDLKTKNGYNLSFSCKDWNTNSQAGVIAFTNEVTNVIVIPTDNIEFLITNDHPVKITKE